MRLAETYSPDHPSELTAHAILLGTYAAGFAGLLFALRRRKVRAMSLMHPLMLGLATHKLARLISKGKVTNVLRAPFTRFEGNAGAGEVEETPRGEGLRYAVGELLACPFCLAPWVAASLVGTSALWPQEGRLVVHLFTTVAVSDFLQKGYAWLSSQTAENRNVAEFFDKAAASATSEIPQ